MRNIEIDKFTTKAEHYKYANKKYPYARIIEVSTIVSIIEGWLKNTLLSRKDVCIVDLMSGDGYLSGYLYKMGFTNIHAIEVCNSMSVGSDIYKKVKIHPLNDIKEVDATLRDIKPTIIVSLAAFHHLIVHDEDKKVDREASVDFQLEIINKCKEHISDNGFLLIVDLIDMNVINKDNQYLKIQHWGVGGKLKTTIKNTSSDLYRMFCEANSISDLNNNFKNEGLHSIQENFSVQWFREIITSENTTIKHDDIAISTKLVEILNKNNPIEIEPICCPWFFYCKDDLINYIYHKFGFILNKSYQKENVLNNLGVNNKIISSEKYNLFPWNLSALIIYKRKDNKLNKKNILIHSTIWTLSLCCLVLFLLILFKITGVDGFIATIIEDRVLYLLLGACIPQVISTLSIMKE